MAKFSGPQLQRVYNALADGKFKTLEEISQITGDRPKSIASRIRDLRLPCYGNHNISTRKQGEVWEYALLSPSLLSPSPAANTPKNPVTNTNTNTNTPANIRFLDVDTYQIVEYQDAASLDGIRFPCDSHGNIISQRQVAL